MWEYNITTNIKDIKYLIELERNIKNKYKPYLYVKAYNDTALKNLAVNLVEGRVPQNSNEIVIPTHLETNGVLSIMSEINLF